MSLPEKNQFADIARIILPTLFAFVIFILTVFGYFLPTYEQTLMDRRRATLQELTGLAQHILIEFQQQELAGELTRSAAQQQAIAMLRPLRYGPNDEQYFWINDENYRLIMHPYRTDLEGQSLADYTDPTGQRIFVEFVNEGARPDGGFVAYMWQWHDDASRIIPKLSHVRPFKPWHWVIGTGMYMNDVQEDISRLTRRMQIASLGMLVFMSIIVGIIVRGGIRVAKARHDAEIALLHHQDNLEKTVEERTAELRATNSALQHENAERLALEKELEELASNDVLTGLMNRRGFVMAAETRLAEAKRAGTPLYLVYADLDNMKAINDKLGHVTGDLALKEFAHILREDFRAGDISGRLGGDEFAMLLTSTGEYTDEQQITDLIQNRICERNRQLESFQLEVSVGVVRHEADSDESLDSVLARADEIMYAVKQARKKNHPCA